MSEKRTGAGTKGVPLAMGSKVLQKLVFYFYLFSVNPPGYKAEVICTDSTDCIEADETHVFYYDEIMYSLFFVFLYEITRFLKSLMFVIFFMNYIV
jgi:hypothetical protein